MPLLVQNTSILILILSIWLLVDANAALHETCDIEDQCVDEHARCVAGVCLCKADFYEADNMCSKYVYV